MRNFIDTDSNRLGKGEVEYLIKNYRSGRTNLTFINNDKPNDLIKLYIAYYFRFKIYIYINNLKIKEYRTYISDSNDNLLFKKTETGLLSFLYEEKKFKIDFAESFEIAEKIFIEAIQEHKLFYAKKGSKYERFYENGRAFVFPCELLEFYS